jgi:hypothetical protein
VLLRLSGPRDAIPESALKNIMRCLTTTIMDALFDRSRASILSSILSNEMGGRRSAALVIHDCAGAGPLLSAVLNNRPHS